MNSFIRAQRRYCAFCGKAFAIVIPPGESETERDRFCGVCAPLPEESEEKWRNGYVIPLRARRSTSGLEGNMTTRRLLAVGALLSAITWCEPAPAWNNGQSGNSTTNTASECTNPPYATHDWIADHALALVPNAEKAWLTPHKAIYLLGTEAPDNKTIATSCNTPNRGYDDRSSGHSVKWNANFTQMTVDRAARRAQEEYDKAALAYRQGNARAAAYYLGAMAHYIGDLSQYGHTIPDEVHHSDYESWAAQRTPTFTGGHFESYIVGDGFVRRSAYTAAKRTALAVAKGKGQILSAKEMDARWSNKNPGVSRQRRTRAQSGGERTGRRAAHVLEASGLL
jgi:zinc dependent phospholipase C